jgi:cob(I)alamin adenosyltransferase
MVKINRIYTKTGDDGTTGLVGGERVAKDSLKVASYGEVDELNCQLGYARTLALASGSDILASRLAVIQNELFDLGSQLAAPPGEIRDGMPQIDASHVTQLEKWIDEMMEGIPELRSFVLPGGTPLNSVLHIARAVCRRVERSVLALSRQEGVSPFNITYLNRLSDLLFAMARYESHRTATPEFLWAPGKKIGG